MIARIKRKKKKNDEADEGKTSCDDQLINDETKGRVNLKRRTNERTAYRKREGFRWSLNLATAVSN